MKSCLKLDSDYISSGAAGLQLLLLATTGGIFGSVAKHALQVRSSSGEALLWVAVFVWVATLLDFSTRAIGIQALKCRGRICHFIFQTAVFIVVTVLWGVYDTFIPPEQRINGQFGIRLFIFILAIISTVFLLFQTVITLVSAHTGKKSKSLNAPGDKDAVVENGKSEPEQTEAAQQKQEEAASSE